MAKRLKSGKSVRNGNAPAPYTKYKKRPYPYAMDQLARKFPASRTTKSASHNLDKFLACSPNF